MEIFPQNPHISGKTVDLKTLYETALKKLNTAADSLPPSLFFVFCGDVLGSSGVHYEKGYPITFTECTTKASLAFSDDFMESLAMHSMQNAPPERIVTGLMEGRDSFFNLIADHFQRHAETYSPWFGELFNVRDAQGYLDILLAHGSCGAAMRAHVLADLDIDADAALSLLLMTHGHLEAIEGAFFVYGMAKAGKAEQDFKTAVQTGTDWAEWARRKVREWQKMVGVTPQDFAPFYHAVTAVLDKNDPYATITDIAIDGIETRFVVPACAYALQPLWDNGNPESDIPRLITHSLEIGGDPDTICSIALALYGLRWPQSSRRFLESVNLGNQHQK